MKNLRLTTILMMLALIAAAGVAEARWGQQNGGRCDQDGARGLRQGGGRRGACRTALADLPREDLNDFEKQSLLHMREEEKLARDVYRALGEKYDLAAFRNIPRSEQRHMDQLGVLLERYGLEDPVSGNEPGRFENPELQKLHDQLVTEGSRSEVAALRVGATIEDLDIHDLQTALAGDIDNQDITRVYRNLAKGSRNHLRSFSGQLKARGETYQAQHIAQADLDAILAGNWERGPADGTRLACQGKGMEGKGMKGKGAKGKGAQGKGLRGKGRCNTGQNRGCCR